MAVSDSKSGDMVKSGSGLKAEVPQDLAQKSLEKILGLGLKPIPQIYELWFRYYQGDPEIVRAINTHQGVMDEISCHKIYKKYLSDTSREDAVKKIGDQIQQSVAEIATMLSTVQSATTEYGDTLGDVSDKIKNAESLEDLTHVVSAIVQDTKKMVAKNQALELQLVNSSQQVTELKKNLDSVKKEAMTDGLTGLSNRKVFDKYIADMIEEALQTKAPFILMMLDIDYFKKFNDLHGHQVGDQVLRLVARTLTDGVKGRDVVARYGGEEFAVILPETPLAGGIKVADALRRGVETKEVVNKSSGRNLGRITLSIGVAEYHQGESADAFIERADAALYAAKNAGRNRVEAAPSPPL